MLTSLPLLTVRGDDGLAKNISEVIFDDPVAPYYGQVMPDFRHREADEIEIHHRLTVWAYCLLALAFLGAVFAALPECSAANERANVEVGR